MIITRRWHCILRREIARHIEALSPWHRDLINPSRHRAIANQGSFSDAAKIIDPPHKDKKYVDRLTVTARAGNGGKGCVSFWQSSSKGKYRPADGGSGGDGGHVILRASSQMKSLAGIPQMIKAEHGQPGQRQKKHGKRGRDSIILVPLGTVICSVMDNSIDCDDDNEGYTHEKQPEYPPTPSSTRNTHGQALLTGDKNNKDDEIPEWLLQWKNPWIGAIDYRSDIEDNQFSDNNNSPTIDSMLQPSKQLALLGDLVQDGQELTIARGGYGGRGNAVMRALPNRPAPAISHPPQEGQVAKVSLELKLLADIALVGFPNVGKSSVLRAVSHAQPRVANYSFTTKDPQLGVIDYGYGEKVVVADVPGLIQGAHMNKGLGHRFLRHVERTSALVFIVDASDIFLTVNGDGMDGSGSSIDDNKKGRKEMRLRPWEQVECLRYEIGKYSKELLDRPWLVVANKIDKLKGPKRVLDMLEKKVQDIAAQEHEYGGGDDCDDEHRETRPVIRVIGVSARPGDEDMQEGRTDVKAMHIDTLITALRDIMIGNKLNH